MEGLNMPTNFAVVSIASGTRYTNHRIDGIINKPFSEVRACVAKGYEKEALTGIAFGKSIKLNGIAEKKITDIRSFTNSIIEAIESAEQAANERIHKIIYHIFLDGYDPNTISKRIKEALCQANFKKSDIICSDQPVKVQI